jgi:hypothetical protein
MYAASDKRFLASVATSTFVWTGSSRSGAARLGTNHWVRFSTSIAFRTSGNPAMPSMLMHAAVAAPDAGRAFAAGEIGAAVASLFRAARRSHSGHLTGPGGVQPLERDGLVIRLQRWGQRPFRDPAPQSQSLFYNPSASCVISEQWNASFSMPITRRWFDAISGLSQRNLT